MLSALHSIGNDIRWAARMIARRPLLSAVVIASIGIAIGATTGAFSVANAFLLRSWSNDGLDRVVRVRENHARPGNAPDIQGFTLSNLATWRRENTVFEGLAAGTGASATLTTDGRTDRISAALVTANFFSVLGFKPILGRTFTLEEDAPDRRDAVVLSYGMWQSHFGGDSSVLGQHVTLNGRPRVIVGVMPRGISHPYQADLWVPLGYSDGSGSNAQVYAPARLKPGVSVARANAELDAMARRLHDANPSADMAWGAQVSSLRPEMLGRLTRVLYLLAATALLVLCIATANVSTLLLAQGIERNAEVAVRTALGAPRWRVARQFLVYSLMLAIAGGAVGVAITAFTVGPLVSLSPVYGAGEFDIQPRLDWTTLAFTLLVIAAAGIIVGVGPALYASRTNTMSAIRESGRTPGLSRASRVSLKGFVVAQVTLAFVLVVVAGTMARGLFDLQREPWGFSRDSVVAFDLTIPLYRFSQADARINAVNAVLDRVRQLPGVRQAGGTTLPPLFAGSSTAPFTIEGAPATNERGAYPAHFRAITPGYLEALRIHRVEGRTFEAHDAMPTPKVVIISESLARRYWPGSSALGKRIKLGTNTSDAPWMEVVGVVASLRENEEQEIPGPDVLYIPHAQAAGAPNELTIMVYTASDPASLVPAVRSAVAGVDRDVAIADVTTLRERFVRFTATERLTTTLTFALGMVGLFLTAIGLYGLLAFSLSRRQAEFGIRAALGARPGDVRTLILRDAILLVGAGIVLGAPLAFVVRPLVDARLFAATAAPALFLASAIILVVVALASTAVPVLRAGRISPLRALRGD